MSSMQFSLIFKHQYYAGFLALTYEIDKTQLVSYFNLCYSHDGSYPFQFVLGAKYTRRLLKNDETTPAYAVLGTPLCLIIENV